MGWFSPIKGQYPSLAQIDKTLNVGAGEEGITRGSLIYVDAGTSPQSGEGVFRLADDTQATDPLADLFVALQGQDDFVAGMAGTIGQGPATDENGVAGTARITGLSVRMPLEFQTDQYYGNLGVGDYLTVGVDGDTNVGGKFVAHTAGDNVIAQVTAAPFERWVNDAVAVEGRRTGAAVTVIQARFVWVPKFTA